jgi:hypothetical protein
MRFVPATPGLGVGQPQETHVRVWFVAFPRVPSCAGAALVKGYFFFPCAILRSIDSISRLTIWLSG